MASSEQDAALAAVPSEAPTIYWRIGASEFDEESPIEDIPLSPSFSPCLLPEDVKVEAPVVRRSGYRRRKSFQGKRYTPEEDECICNAWLLISQDPFWGTIRRIDGFFERVADHFNKHIKRNAPRSIASVKGRWHFIRRVCTKFTSYVAEVEKSDPIGVSEADKVEMAKELWAKDDGGKPFLYEKCWRFLKDTPEWKLDSGAVPAPLAALCGLEGNSVEGVGAKALVTISNTEDGGTLANDTIQPEGHKKAKLHKDSSPSATTSSNNVEMKPQELGREMLEDKEEKIKVREAKEAALEAQNSFYEFQRIEDNRQMAEAIKRLEEEDKRREEDDRRREEANIRKEENAILATMVNDLDEELKASIMEQKRNIIARRRFDKIIKKEIPSKVSYEDDKVLAFRDISPQAPTHIILIPKVTDGLTGLSKAEQRHTEILGYLLYVAKLVAKQEGLEDGFRIVINDGPTGCQSVHHLHVHLLGGRHMSWPPG